MGATTSWSSENVARKTRDAFHTAATVTYRYRVKHRARHYHWFENRLRGIRSRRERGARDAERIAADHVGDIDVLLTDIVLPGMRRPELAARLRSKHPGVRVVYMSGFRDTEPLADVQRGEAVFLAKPFQRAALLGAISRVATPTS